MFKLTIAENSYSCQTEETVLDALLRQDVAISYACKQGSCHSCLVRSADAQAPANAQTGLKDTQKKLGFFLACLCHPERDMTIKLPDQSEFYSQGTVVTKAPLNSNTLLLEIAFEDAFEFNAGQFVNLQRADGLTRSYSIANIPRQTHSLEFHIRCLPNGQFGSWVRDELEPGDGIAVSEPRGHCFYLPERSEQGLLLIGTGTGLAPLAGILTDALRHGHSGPIYLFHGSRDLEGLYRIEEMRRLANEHANFHYFPCVSGPRVPEGFASGRANDIALDMLAELKGWRVFLCGNPDMVNQTKLKAFLKGAAMGDIYTDAFFSQPQQASDRKTQTSRQA